MLATTYLLYDVGGGGVDDRRLFLLFQLHAQGLQPGRESLILSLNTNFGPACVGLRGGGGGRRAVKSFVLACDDNIAPIKVAET